MLKPVFVAVWSVAAGATATPKALPPNCTTCAGTVPSVALEGVERTTTLIVADIPVPVYVMPAILVENAPGSDPAAGGAALAGNSPMQSRDEKIVEQRRNGRVCRFTRL